MSIIDMHKMNPEGTVFLTTETFATKEYADKSMPMYLEEKLVQNSKGNFIRNYRLHVSKPTSIETALSYDIICPQCHVKCLRQIGRCLNAYDLGLYKCPACDKD